MLIDLHPTPSASPVADAAALLGSAKFAYSTRHLAHRRDLGLTADPTVVPRAGDVVLARVTELGHHKRLESPVSRRQNLFIGDLIVVAYGSRYAADQFLARVPDDLGPCHLVAGGGMAALVEDQHARVEDATRIEPIGLLTEADGTHLNLTALAPYAVGAATTERNQVPVIAVVGTSMNSGKSTVLAHLARGLADSGLRVHAGKATGTGAGNDVGLFADAGAHRVLDFTDFGYETTFRLGHDRVRDLFSSMLDELTREAEQGAPDVALVEIADGVYQAETAALLADELFAARIDTVVFAAADALGAAAGVQAIRSHGHRPALVSGVVTASPIMTREATVAVDVPVMPTFDLSDPAVAAPILARHRVAA